MRVLLLSKFVRAKSRRLLFISSPATWTIWLEAFPSGSLIFLISLEFNHRRCLARRLYISMLLVHKVHVLLQRFQFQLVFFLLLAISVVYLALFVNWLGLWKSVITEVTLWIRCLTSPLLLGRTTSFIKRGLSWMLLLLRFLNTTDSSIIFQILQGSSSFILVKTQRFLLTTMICNERTRTIALLADV